VRPDPQSHERALRARASRDELWGTRIEPDADGFSGARAGEVPLRLRGG
jgi:hypothetical protein